MSIRKTIFVLTLTISFMACGSATTTNQSSTDNNNTGTVEIIGQIGQLESNNSVSYLVEEASVDELLVRNYRVSLGDSEDCANANFVDIFDETDDTSDCVADPDDTSLFMDISSAPTLGMNNAIAAGTYSCVRITVCDQLVWQSDDLDGCPGTNVSDIHDPRDEASVLTFYYSTSEDELINDEDAGTINMPFPLTDALEVIAGETTTLTFEMSNSATLNGMVAEYDDEADDEFMCEVPAPQMTIIAE